MEDFLPKEQNAPFSIIFLNHDISKVSKGIIMEYYGGGHDNLSPFEMHNLRLSALQADL